MNKKTKRNLLKVLGISLLLLFVIGSIILSVVASVHQNDFYFGLSLFCSLLGIILSTIAIWYTFYSGIKLDSQFNELGKLIKQMRTIQHEIDSSINRLSEMEEKLPPELKEKVDSFKEDLKNDSFSIF